jgi:acyl-lipid omega-6 desaturase (Delta-12 desaturase)
LNAGAQASDLGRILVRTYATPSDARGAWQTGTTLIPLALLWWACAASLAVSAWLTALLVLPLALFHLRVFALLHDCGHGCLFRSGWLNRAVGFVYGVVSGMPQYVWSKHHDFHHRTNGDWERYRGPLGTLAIEEYERLTPRQQRRYQQVRSLPFAPLGGFVYLLFNPRINWMKGTAALLWHLLRGRPAAEFTTRYWKSWREYAHMSGNNLVLLPAWAAMSWAIGAGPFFAIYIAAVSIAGAGGIILFTVQHNFEHAYASETRDWSLGQGAIDGTSYLVLPRWLDWFTADIGYHHVHHLSAAIPNYRLRECHLAHEDAFVAVKRITLSQVPASLRCILWDKRARRIIPVAEYERQRSASPEAQAQPG